METETAGAQLAKRVAACGVETVFSLAGAGHTHFLLPLREIGVRIVGTRHETGAVGAADGYARATGGLGVAAIIAEQGLPNAVAPISTAFHHGTPMVVLMTRFPDSWVEAAGEYAVDHHALIKPICKWVRTVPSSDKLVEYFDTATRIARSGRPGPVVLVIPQDFLAQPAVSEVIRATPSVPFPAAPNQELLKQAVALISDAKRPAILVDSGLLDQDTGGAEAGAALQSLNTEMGFPVFEYGSARGVIPENQGSVLPWPFAQTALKEIDLLIVAGARLNMWYGFGRKPRFPDGMKVIQFDTEAAEIGRNQAVTLGSASDPAASLAELAKLLQQGQATSHSADWLQEALAARHAAIEPLASRGEDKIHALELIKALEHHRPKDGIFVADGADILNWSYALVRIARVRGYMDHHPLGSMGMSLPLALGAAAAERDLAAREGRPPVRTTLLTGDGSIGFYLAEMDTIVREKLPLTIVVGNDGQWGTEVHGQRLMTGQTVNTELGVGDYGQIARGFGMHGLTVDHASDLDTALSRAFGTEGPALVDIRIDPAAGSALKTDPNLSFLIFSDLAPPSH